MNHGTCDACGSVISDENGKDQTLCLAHRPLRVGDRVRINIINQEEYAVGAYESLQGATGAIEEIELSRRTPEYGQGKSSYLVRFDTQRPIWWAYQSPVTAFRFLSEELVRL